jgi:hypothetical protein
VAVSLRQLEKIGRNGVVPEKQSSVNAQFIMCDPSRCDLDTLAISCVLSSQQISLAPSQLSQSLPESQLCSEVLKLQQQLSMKGKKSVGWQGIVEIDSRAENAM